MSCRDYKVFPLMDLFHGCLGDWAQALRLTDRYGMS